MQRGERTKTRSSMKDQKIASQKREFTEKKLEQAKQQAELALIKQRQQFEERNKKVEEKRRFFES